VTSDLCWEGRTAAERVSGNVRYGGCHRDTDSLVGSSMRADEIPVSHVTIHGNAVAYRRAGEGPVLLLLHGIAGSSETWVPAMRLLQREYTVIAPDFLGHGASAKPPGDYSLGNYAAGMRDLLDLLEIDRATVIGQSFGGGVAMQFAYQFPERCERLVLVDAGGLGREVSWLLRLVTLPGAEYVLPALFLPQVRDCGNSILSFLKDRGIHSVRAAEMWRSFGSLTDPANRGAFVRTMRAVIDPGGQAVSAIDRLYLAQEMPTLIVWGDRDTIIPISHAHQAHEAMPNSRLEIMEGVGHFPHVEEPYQFVEIVVDFLRTTTPSDFTPEARRHALLQRTGSESS
jgi:pimeloyl-ACP methyl ester carboxylesterase